MQIYLKNLHRVLSLRVLLLSINHLASNVMPACCFFALSTFTRLVSQRTAALPRQGSTSRPWRCCVTLWAPRTLTAWPRLSWGSVRRGWRPSSASSAETRRHLYLIPGDLENPFLSFTESYLKSTVSLNDQISPHGQIFHKLKWPFKLDVLRSFVTLFV